MSEAKYKRVLLKLSGEALAGDQKTGVNSEVVGNICDKIKEIVENVKMLFKIIQKKSQIF